MRQTDFTFTIADDVLALGLKGVYFSMAGLTNRESDPEFEAVKNATLSSLLPTLSAEAIAGDPILQGFRDLHTAVGFSNHNFVSAPENLLLNLLRNGRFPHVNLLVDIYNLVSLETHLALGAHDIAHVEGNIDLRLTTGDEGFWPIGATQPKRTRPGGYAYVDGAHDVLCMLEVRQVEKTKATLETTECFYIVQGNAQTSTAFVQSTAERLIALTKKYCGGTERMLGAA